METIIKDECKCEYVEAPNGYEYLVKRCEECMKNHMLPIVDAIINVQNLVNIYKQLAINIRESKDELIAFNKEYKR